MPLLTQPALSLERVIKVADTLPCAPMILTALQELLSDPNADFEHITFLLRRDITLTSRLIRLANSIVYRRGEPAGSLEEALARVGFSEAYRLTTTVVMLQLADIPLRYYPITPQALRENSLLCALLMEELAPRAGVDARTAYTAGLLRSIGRIALDVAAQRDRGFRRPPELGANDLVPWETAVFGLTSANAGAGILKAWRFQADVFVAVRDQFLHQLAIDAMPMAKLLHVAIAAGAQAGYGLAGGFGYVEEGGAQARNDLNLSEVAVAEVLAGTLPKFGRLKAVLG